MFLNIIYVLATINLLICSSLSFHYSLYDYLFLTGTSLLCFHSMLKLLSEIRNKMKAKPKIHLYTNI